MEFVLGKARLTFRHGQGYQHPRTGRWEAAPLMCLKGWKVDDPEERRQWTELISHIEEYWRRQLPVPASQDMEVDFTPGRTE